MAGLLHARKAGELARAGNASLNATLNSKTLRLPGR